LFAIAEKLRKIEIIILTMLLEGFPPKVGNNLTNIATNGRPEFLLIMATIGLIVTL
jgi:hypothetical protein